MDDYDNKKKQRSTWKISPFLHKEIETHLLLLKTNLKQKILKKKWFEDAILEKLDRQEETQKDWNQERVGIQIDSLTLLKLEERIKKICVHLGEYTKQQYILEAVQEKLSMEEEAVKQKISEQRLLLNELRDRK